MPRPRSPYELIYSPGGHFPYTSWEDHARTYQYFRVFGFNEFRRLTGSSDYSNIEDNELVDNAKAIVKKDWGNYLPPSSSNKDGIDLIGKNQVKRVRQKRTVAFQSACVAIVALELALKESGSSCDIYEDSLPNDPHRVAICPSLFQINDYNQEFYKKHIVGSPSDYADLIKATLQRQSYSKNSTDNVFLDMAKGGLVTEWLATRFLDFWRARAATFAAISVCRPRIGNSFRKPSELEVQVFPLV